ncbi:hypothetical protein [Microbacterium sp. TPD7012]|uniref:hypothetical protein n=1 Tax=Microbacterium sp. TPD7012 TaxID=2171975 RepID=UPI000D51D25F|nr:hypothetical protein [Microbacterium sp. TPD7012]PVE97919.1 hypothetical protein DC434_00090 [Microbacterium sp. TPD7012]
MQRPADFFGPPGAADSFVWSIVLMIGVLFGLVAVLMIIRDRPHLRARAWWIFGGACLLAIVAAVSVQYFRVASATRDEMTTQLEFPVDYHDLDGGDTAATFTLSADGTAELRGLSLGTEERSADGDRRCLAGDVIPVVGEGRWWTTDQGWVIVEADDRRTRFVQDDSLLMAEGWGKVYVLTPCTEDYTATFVTPDLQ